MIKKNVMWNVAGGINSSNIHKIIIRLNQIKPGLINSTYDCYTILKWMGGRPFTQVPRITPREFVGRVKELNAHGIGFYHVFSNFYISAKDLDDPWGNYFLEHTQHSLNGVICANNLMANYLRKNYPSFKVIGSCTPEEKNVYILRQLQDIYDVIVLPPSLNKDYKLIEQLDISRIEILVSEACREECKARRLHYSLNNKWNISHDIRDLERLYDFVYQDPESCFDKSTKLIDLSLKKHEFDKLVNMGVRWFKLTERSDELKTVWNIYKFAIGYTSEPLIEKYRTLRGIPWQTLMHALFYNKFHITIKRIKKRQR